MHRENVFSLDGFPEGVSPADKVLFTVDENVEDSLPGQGAIQLARDGLNLGQFGHSDQSFASNQESPLSPSTVKGTESGTAFSIADRKSGTSLSSSSFSRQKSNSS